MSEIQYSEVICPVCKERIVLDEWRWEEIDGVEQIVCLKCVRRLRRGNGLLDAFHSIGGPAV